jgi:hypothetical protein
VVTSVSTKTAASASGLGGAASTAAVVGGVAKILAPIMLVGAAAVAAGVAAYGPRVSERTPPRSPAVAIAPAKGLATAPATFTAPTASALATATATAIAPEAEPPTEVPFDLGARGPIAAAAPPRSEPPRDRAPTSDPLARVAMLRAEPAPPPPVPAAQSLRPSAPEPSELQLVEAMNAALARGDAAATLGLASEHSRLYPAGVLSQEREGARALALCMTGTTAPASDFVRAHPGSPLVGRMRAMCELSSDGPGTRGPSGQ